ncbi:hypothetical protein J7E78_08810 [Paenibacillus polymyxa]|nr:hypothetical protein [Paenibacillus polymyxa]MBT2283633.1 hypothetical protein [Paenibacillus polymyxa]
MNCNNDSRMSRLNTITPGQREEAVGKMSNKKAPALGGGAYGILPIQRQA